MITASDITIRIGETSLFSHTSFVIEEGEHVAFLGGNGAGKTTLAKALAGLLPLQTGEIIFHFAKNGEYPYPSTQKHRVAYISFETHQAFVQRHEQEETLQAFSTKTLKKTTVKDVLKQESTRQKKDYVGIVQTLGIHSLLQKSLMSLSNGETRKVVMAKELIKNPKLIILDEPFEGLDKSSRKQFFLVVQQLMKEKRCIILITHHHADILPEINRVFHIENGAIIKQEKHIQKKQRQKIMKQMLPMQKKRSTTPIITVKNISLSYEKQIIFHNFSWRMCKGENWAIVGENGVGKTSLLNMITGENLQSYGQDIALFGKKKDDLSIWDIRKHIGIVSPQLQLSWGENQQGIGIILSGLSNTIGLYKNPTKREIQKAQKIAKQLNITVLLTKYFSAMSFGEKRMILIARALIKVPQLLILDEVCSGLDETNRKTILELLAFIGAQTKTQLLYITHREEELLPCITHKLLLGRGSFQRQMQRKGRAFTDFTV